MSDLLIQILAYALMFLGVLGAVLPLLPGPPLIWLGAVLWAWADGFRAVGPGTLLLMGILAVLAWGSDLLLTTVFARASGAGWKAVAGAIVGGMVGGILLGWLLPVLGTIMATFLGAVAGIVAVAYRDLRQWQPALRAALGYIVGYLLAGILELVLALLMIGLFLRDALGR